MKAFTAMIGIKIKREYLCICLLFSCSLLSCAEELQIGARARKFKMDDGAVLVLTTPSQQNETHQVQYKSITYSVTFDKDRVIRAILTNDQKFATPEGVRMGTTYKDIIIKEAAVKADTSIGVLQQVLLKSGWYAVLQYAQPFTDTARVGGFYKK